MEINGKIENGKTNISSKDEDISVEIGKNLNIFLRNIDVVLDPKIQDSTMKKDMNIVLQNSKLKIDNDFYHLNL